MRLTARSRRRAVPKRQSASDLRRAEACIPASLLTYARISFFFSRIIRFLLRSLVVFALLIYSYSEQNNSKKEGCERVIDFGESV